MGNKKNFIGVIDLGTTSVRFIIFNLKGVIISESYKSIKQFYPSLGWVEEDPNEIWESTQNVISEGMLKSSIEPPDIIALGICNQRESIVVWNKEDGNPLSNVIVWQDRRTSERCDQLKNSGYESIIKDKTGLVLDPYFSATKLEWLLKNDNSLNKYLKKSNLVFGTVDSWVIYKLTDQHLTDVSNASRTMLFNINDLSWDVELLDIFNIPESILPDVLPSFGNSIYGHTKKDSILKHQIPICSVFGDQQASLFGHRCFSKYDVKSTFGTGTFLMMNTGNKRLSSNSNLLTTVFYQSNKGDVFYALEGSIYNTGSVFQWLKDELGIIHDYNEIGEITAGLDYQSNLFFVPAFTGLGAPYWDPYASGIIIGISRSTSKKEIIRAAEESIAYGVCDLVAAIEKDTGVKLTKIKIDGGVSKNDSFCQVLSDLTGIKVIKFPVKEITALGAMYGAGLGIGIWENPLQIGESSTYFEFHSKIGEKLRKKLYKNWCRAVSRSRNWIIDGYKS